APGCRGWSSPPARTPCRPGARAWRSSPRPCRWRRRTRTSAPATARAAVSSPEPSAFWQAPFDDPLTTLAWPAENNDDLGAGLGNSEIVSAKSRNVNDPGLERLTREAGVL